MSYLLRVVILSVGNNAMIVPLSRYVSVIVCESCEINVKRPHGYMGSGH